MTRKLLVADDSATIQKVVTLAFAGEDFVVESVSSGDEAINKAKIWGPDLILADVYMPGPNGYEVCEAVKTHPELSHVPVILLVGAFEPFDEVEAARVKCDAFLTKPFDTSELFEVVHSFLPGRQQPASVEAPLFDEGSSGAVTPPESPLGEPLIFAGTLASSRARQSFMGADCILDLYRPETVAAPEAPQALESASVAKEATAPSPAEVPTASAMPAIPEEVLNHIVERVIERISTEAVREVAWEVVPELSEILIRQHLKEQEGKSQAAPGPAPAR